MARSVSLFLTVLLACFAAGAEDAIYLGVGASSIEKQAAMDLQQYLYQATGEVASISTVASIPEEATGYILGTPGSLPSCPEDYPFELDPPQHDGYLLHGLDEANSLVIVAATSPRGVQNGVFGYLEMCGFGFYPSQTTVPVSWAGRDEMGQLHSSQSPAFPVRGAAPWHAYFTGPAAWNLADYEAYIDQIVRMRINTIVFHTDDSKPFAAYPSDGAMAGGKPLPNTSQQVWGGAALPTHEFFAGTSGYFAHDFFGADSSLEESEADAIKAAKDTLRAAMRYARQRGLRIGLGFDVSGDPLDPEVLAQFEARLTALIADYPMLDDIWLWEPEGRALHPAAVPAPGSPWETCVQRYEGSFPGLDYARRAEAVRMCLFAQYAHQMLAVYQDGPRLAMAGWGGDDWFRFTDFLPGMNTILPEGVPFAALDNLTLTPDVSDVYGTLPATREKWPMLCLEYDGDQWMPQPNVMDAAGACRDALSKGCQGLFLQHSRVRAVDATAAYCARFAWDPNLEADAFLDQYASDLFGEEHAEELGQVLTTLESLGYRWIGGRGQSERGPFSWTPGDDTKAAQLAEAAHILRPYLSSGDPLGDVLGDVLEFVPGVVTELRIPALFKRSGKKGRVPATKQASVHELAAQVAFVIAYDQAARDFQEAEPLALTPEQIMELPGWEHLMEAMHLHAHHMRTKGELGVLATMNTKAWARLRETFALDEAMLETLCAMPEGNPPPPSLIVLPGRVILAGVHEEELEVTLRARRLGDKAYETYPLEPIGGSSYALSFPPEFTGAGPFEYGVEVRNSVRQILAWPHAFPERAAVKAAFSGQLERARSPLAGAPAREVALRAELLARDHAMLLRWDTAPGEVYSVFRDAELLATVADGWFKDPAAPSGGRVTYAIRTRSFAGGPTATAYRTVALPELPLPEPPADVTITTRSDRAVLGWPAAASNVIAYEVARMGAGQDIDKTDRVMALPGHYMTYSDQVAPESAVSYAVTPVAADGELGPSSAMAGVIVSGAPLNPRIDLSSLGEGFLNEFAKLTADGITLGGGGWEDNPGYGPWAPERELTLSVWVNIEDVPGMPVIVCKGNWEEPAYYLQVFQNQLRFYLNGVGTVDAGVVTPSVWHHLAATYAAQEMRLYMDGQLVGYRVSQDAGLRAAAQRQFERFAQNPAVHLVQGLADNFRVYDAALTPQEVAALYQEQRGLTADIEP